MSIAAAAAVLTSGAFAFETTEEGNLTDLTGRIGDYVLATENSSDMGAPLTVDNTNSGDALIFPAFNAADNWKTEIVVRNNEDFAVLAKLVAYSGHDSQELRDFNIYLSANDVFRAEIVKENGKTYIRSNDDSVNITGFGNGLGDNITLPEDTGYIVVYGQASAPDITVHSADVTDPKLDPKQTLYNRYLFTLDDVRDIVKGENDDSFPNGVYQKTPQHPVVGYPKLNIVTGWDDVHKHALSGTVRIYNETGEARDLLLPATAIKNYTDGFIMMWAERELAAFADRNLRAIAPDTVIYDEKAVRVDASSYAFGGKDLIYYTFNNAQMNSSTDAANKLILTQVLKRTLIQLGNDDGYWAPFTKCTEKAGWAGNVETGATYGAAFGAKIWDEAEYSDQSSTPPVSPGLTIDPQVVCKEVAELADLEKLAVGDIDFADKNGYVAVRFQNGLPAIPTQMSASQVGDSVRINWVNAPVVGEQ